LPDTVLKSQEVLPSGGHGDRERAHVHRALVLTVLVTLLWRVPSLFDPPWVNDEGTYFAVAQAMSHGYHLYQDVWENKPPALYLVYMAVYHLAGPSLLVIRVLSALAVCGLVLLTFLIARRFAGARIALAAAMLCGLLLDVPFLEGTTGNAEVFMSVGTALAVYLALVLQRPGGAGVAAPAEEGPQLPGEGAEGHEGVEWIDAQAGFARGQTDEATSRSARTRHTLAQ